MERVKLATVWLGGCSGCHMSFLDLDEWLIELAGRVDVVYSPLIDVKHYPSGVDLALVEGAAANEEHVAMLRRVRANTRLIVAFGDCAVTGNVTALRNPLGLAIPLLQRVYAAGSDRAGTIPSEAGIVPALLDKVVPIHAVVPVDVYLQGCPPSAARIRAAVEGLLEGAGAEPLAGRFG